MASFNELIKKKVAGVPVLYLAGAFVIILAIVAWKMKPTPESVSPSEEGGASPDSPGGVTVTDDPYEGLETQGTVIVQPTTPSGEPVEEPSNRKWLESSVKHLIDINFGSSPGYMEASLTKYLNGEDLTYQEGMIRDAAIKKFGLPPEGTAGIGQTGKMPATKQGNPPLQHTVKGDLDNRFYEIAFLYFNKNSGRAVQIIQAANAGLGPDPTLSPGTKVMVPAYSEPKYYTANPSALTLATIAAKNGITQPALQRFNGSMTFPVKAGTKVVVG